MVSRFLSPTLAAPPSSPSGGGGPENWSHGPLKTLTSPSGGGSVHIYPMLGNLLVTPFCSRIYAKFGDRTPNVILLFVVCNCFATENIFLVCKPWSRTCPGILAAPPFPWGGQQDRFGRHPYLADAPPLPPRGGDRKTYPLSTTFPEKAP